MMPDKYKNETDYRKIPREYLNSRIPQVSYSKIRLNTMRDLSSMLKTKTK
ncbi:MULTISPECIES: hypothetical protein [Staphylococcus]|nr:MULTISPECIES: hypothetical protein [Staphylococcus]